MDSTFFEVSALDRYTISDIVNINDNVGREPLTYALEYLFFALSTGSLCIDLNDPEFTKKHFLYAEQFINNIKSGVYGKIVSTDEADFKPLILRKSQSGALFLYFYRYYISERKFEKLIKERLAFTNRNLIDKTILDKLINEADNNQPLADEKKIAVYIALTEKFLIITGGPGTGKTYTAAKVVCYFTENYKKNNHGKEPVIRLTAPTGKAAKRLGEQLSKVTNETIAGETIHRLLKYQGNDGKFFFNNDNKIPADLIIVDEVSMIDINLFSSLLEAVDNETTLVIIGDRDQLPSVDAGAVLKDLLSDSFEISYSIKVTEALHLAKCNHKENAYTDRIVELKNQHRSAEKIGKIATMINSGDTGVTKLLTTLTIDEIYKNELADDLYFVDINNFDTYKQFLNFYYRRYYNNKEYNKLVLEFGNSGFEPIFKKSTSSKILTILRDGFYGANGINEYILKLYCKEEFHRKCPMSGVPIMITSNDYNTGLFNGESGVILSDSEGVAKAYFPDEAGSEDFKVYSMSFLNSFATSFALTVHKSQGSEYEDIFLILPNDTENALLTREIIYTAITRAKKRVFVLGKMEILEKAVSNKIFRFSGINKL